MKPKGMHDIATAQSHVNYRSIPATRAKTVAQLARMEHERARLERELNVWVRKQQQSERRLRQVLQYIGLLQRVLDGDGDRGQAADDDEWAKGFRGITLEY